MKLEKHSSEILRLEKRMAPISVTIYPTDKCSCKCIMCDIHKNNEKMEIGFDVLKRTLFELDKIGVESVVFLGGGEPTLYSHLGKIIEYISEETSLKVGILTNGHSRFDYAKYIRFECVQFIRFSIDAIESKYNKKIRGVESNIIMNNFIDALKSAPEKVRMNTLVMKQNIKHLKDIINFAFVSDTTINFTLPVDIGDFKNTFSSKDIQCLFELLSYHPEVHNLAEQWKQYKLQNKNRCILPIIKAVIDCGGEVYPCTIAANSLGHLSETSKNKVSLGNIHDNDFMKIWYNNKFRIRMALSTKENDVCKWCSDGGIKTCKLYMQYRNEYEEIKTKRKAIFL